MSVAKTTSLVANPQRLPLKPSLLFKYTSANVFNFCVIGFIVTWTNEEKDVIIHSKTSGSNLNPFRSNGH